MSFEFPDETYVFPMEYLVEAAARPMTSGDMGIIATFEAEFSTTFGPFTARVAGQEGALRVCGELVSEILVQTQISGRTAMLVLEKPDDAERLASILNSRSCSPPPDS